MNPTEGLSLDSFVGPHARSPQLAVGLCCRAGGGEGERSMLPQPPPPESPTMEHAELGRGDEKGVGGERSWCGAGA